MKFIYLIQNMKLERLTISANSEEEALAKLKDLDVEEYEDVEDDYDFATADLEEVEEE